jgi:hypothetical protein
LDGFGRRVVVGGMGEVVSEGLIVVVEGGVGGERAGGGGCADGVEDRQVAGPFGAVGLVIAVEETELVVLPGREA